VTVVVVDDSAVQRRFVRSALADDGLLEVVGEARNGRDAVALVERLQPSAVLMDLHLPVMNGIEAIERIMAVRPTPIVVYSSFVDGDDRDNATGAIAAGAIDVMQKPGPDDRGDLESYAELLRQRLRVAGRVRVITHPRGRLGVTRATVSTRRLGDGPPRPQTPQPRRPEPPAGVSSPRSGGGSAVARSAVDVLAIGASTGGPQALATLLAELPERTATALLVVQHMADGFIDGLAAWLDGLCPLPVRVGENGRRLAPGSVTVAPSGLNLIVYDGLRVTTEQPPPTQYHVPGIDATFGSVATACGSRAAGVLLTGMGRDGAAGLKAMREAGAHTIAQDEETCAVYGMPAAAMALGAAAEQLPLREICEAIGDLLTPAEAGTR
jgi:two-component system chemotaxis response regulator CheB